MTDHVEVRRESTQYLPCKLTPFELDLKRDELAARMGALEEQERKAAEDAKRAKDDIKVEQGEIRQLGKEIRDREEYRSVPVKELWNYTTGVITEVRQDTGEELNTRRMAWEEQHPQQRLIGDDQGDAAEAVVDEQLATDTEAPAESSKPASEVH